VINTIYIEKAVAEHPRTQTVLERFSQAVSIECERYGEVFNPRSQSFRLQKKRPSLILAEKYKNHVLPAPEGYGIGGQRNYYFSHMLNCLYDCRYCFLQGMYRSAHYVFFVNYEDFKREIEQVLKQNPERDVYFFSGYDCDSLALDSVTDFVKEFVPFFSERPRGILELRTKSCNVEPLLELEAVPNCVVAYSLSPDAVAKALEHKAPPLRARLGAIKKLADAGWPIGLRFDPLVYHEDFRDSYREFFKEVFGIISSEQVHSISFGPMRFPKPMFDKIAKLYPDEPLFAGPMSLRGTMISYDKEREQEMMDFCSQELRRYAPESLFFNCMPESP